MGFQPGNTHGGSVAATEARRAKAKERRESEEKARAGRVSLTTPGAIYGDGPPPGIEESRPEAALGWSIEPTEAVPMEPPEPGPRSRLKAWSGAMDDAPEPSGRRFHDVGYLTSSSGETRPICHTPGCWGNDPSCEVFQEREYEAEAVDESNFFIGSDSWARAKGMV